MTFKELHEDVDQIFSRLEETSMIWFDDDIDRVAFEERVVKIFQEKYIGRLKDSIMGTVNTMMWGDTGINQRHPSINHNKVSQNKSELVFDIIGPRKKAEQIRDEIDAYAELYGSITLGCVKEYFVDAQNGKVLTFTNDDEVYGWTYDRLKGNILLKNKSFGVVSIIFPAPIKLPDEPNKGVTENA